MKQIDSTSYFFCGIGGSGMLPLASLLKGMGASVSGSDRARDQGRLNDKFAKLEAEGFELYPQDGSGLRAGHILIASAAIEDSVPDVVAANRLGLTRTTRAECLAQLFNAAKLPIGIAGTSGKSTTTGLVAHVLSQCGKDPSVMNGADMVDFRSPDTPIASALVGAGAGFVSEIDESDGSIALFNPAIGVLNNVAEDHKPLVELRVLFGAYLKRAKYRVINGDHPEVVALADGLDNTLSYSLDAANPCPSADFIAMDIVPRAGHAGSDFRVYIRETGQIISASIRLPGRHNVANAMAALCVAQICDIAPEAALAALATCRGVSRRFEIIGRHNDITVIDDFGHNPDKIAATFRTLRSDSGRLLVLFQPHGFGPLRLMKDGFIASFIEGLSPEDYLLMPEPVYYGGTTNRSVSTKDIIAGVSAMDKHAEAHETRADTGSRLVQLAQAGDRIVIMGARDDSLTEFAHDVFAQIRAKFP